MIKFNFFKKINIILIYLLIKNTLKNNLQFIIAMAYTLRKIIALACRSQYLTIPFSAMYVHHELTSNNSFSEQTYLKIFNGIHCIVRR